jgi:hypothetical protein
MIGTLEIAPGLESGRITVPVCPDGTFEANETFRVRLSGEVNVAFGDALANGAILNDDPPDVSIAGRLFTEGDPPSPGSQFSGGVIPPEFLDNSSPKKRSFALRLSGPTTEQVTVTWETRSKGATGGPVCRQDNRTPLGTQLPTSRGVTLNDFITATGRSAVFAPGMTSATITIETCRDFEAERAETFRIVLTGATNANITDGTATCTLTDDD